MAKIISVASGKGGTGKSTVTAALSRALARIGCSVLAVDLDSGLRSLDILLGMEDKIVFDLRDVMRGVCPAADAIVSCGENLSLLCAPAERAALDADAVSLFLKRIAASYEYVVLDLPAGIGFSAAVAEQIADLTLLVATPDVLTMRDARSTADVILCRGSKACRLVANKISRESMLAGGLSDLDELIDGIGIPLLAVVPEDPFINVTNEKVRSSVRRSPFTNRVFEAMARRVTGEYLPLLLESV